jgi:lysophospholipase L1-like esterase
MHPLSLTLALLMGAAPDGSTTVAPDDPRLVVVGRSATADGVTRFDWPGVRVSFRLRGAGFRILLNGTGPDFNVLVDGQPWTKLGTWGAAGYDLWLPDGGTHDVTLVRRQGPVFGATHFAGLELPAGVTLLDPPPPLKRRIEFVGDSLTVGYGVEAVWSECSDLRPFENVAKAYGSLTADALEAEAWFVAASGHGLVRNYGDVAGASERPMTALYGAKLFSEPATTWTPDAKADAVVVFLGTNDVSTEPAVPHLDLVAGFRRLLGQVRALHGASVPLFLLSHEGRPQITSAVAQTIKEEGDAGHAGLHAVTLPRAAGDYGCHAHPGAQTHRRWAESLTEVMRAALGW